MMGMRMIDRDGRNGDGEGADGGVDGDGDRASGGNGNSNDATILHI